jgi:hypothetical protein
MAEPHCGIERSKATPGEFSPRLQRGLTQAQAMMLVTHLFTLQFRNGARLLSRFFLGRVLTRIAQTSTAMGHCGLPSIGPVGVTERTQT